MEVSITPIDHNTIIATTKCVYTMFGRDVFDYVAQQLNGNWYWHSSRIQRLTPSPQDQQYIQQGIMKQEEFWLLHTKIKLNG